MRVNDWENQVVGVVRVACQVKPRDDGFVKPSASSVCSPLHLALACVWTVGLCAATPSHSLCFKSVTKVFCNGLFCQCSPFWTKAARSLHHRATATGVGVKAVGSWPMLCSLISVVVFSVCTVDGTTEEDVLCIHEWLIMSSKDGRSAGLRDRHHLISCWHSGGGGGGGQPISLEQ